MRFIISENKLENLKINFLNSYVKDKDVRTFDSFILIQNNDTDDYENEDPHFEYDYSDGRLYVGQNVRNNFSNIFGYDKKHANQFFKNWFEDKFKVEVAFVD